MFIIQIERGQVAHTDTIFSTSRTAHRTFLAFRREIEHNYRSMHTVKEYATLLNVSTKTLTNYVNECSTHTPLEMINNRIILEAKRMLRYSDMMVKEIAAQLGFDDPSYFVKFFKRLVKASPADYRTPNNENSNTQRENTLSPNILPQKATKAAGAPKLLEARVEPLINVRGSRGAAIAPAKAQKKRASSSVA